MVKKIKTIIVDDNPVFLEGLASLLKKESRFDILAKLYSGKNLLEFSGLMKADLILMDIEMPELNGIEAAKRVNFIDQHVKMIAITMYQDKVYLQHLVEAGFRGFVNKSEVAINLFKVIDEVMQNQFVYPENIKIL
jgi:DNA-binding NarL/FixJ family response regulator